MFAIWSYLWSRGLVGGLVGAVAVGLLLGWDRRQRDAAPAGPPAPAPVPKDTEPEEDEPAPRPPPPAIKMPEIRLVANTEGLVDCGWTDDSKTRPVVVSPTVWGPEMSRGLAVNILRGQGHEGALAALDIFEAYRWAQAQPMRDALDARAGEKRRELAAADEKTKGGAS